MLATYMRRMRNYNLEIRIAGSSCRPQLMIIPRVRVGYEMVDSLYLISKKREWNNCFIKSVQKILIILPDFICENNGFSACF